VPVYPWQHYSLQQIHSLANDPLGTAFRNLLSFPEKVQREKGQRRFSAGASCAFLAHWKSKRLKKMEMGEKKWAMGKKSD